MRIDRVPGVLALVTAGALLSTAAVAHPHVPGDPFADVDDTIVAGSARVAPIRSASHQRWSVTDVRGGERKPAGTIEQRVTRADTPAGRQWCVSLAHSAPGVPATTDSVFLTAGPSIPVYWILRSRGTGTFTFDGREVSGTWANDTLSLDDVTFSLLHASFPMTLERLVLSRLEYRPGPAVAIAFFDPRREAGEYHLAIEVAGETRLDHARHERRCWLLAVADDRSPGASRTVWIDAATHAVLREEIRNASGDLLEVLEAE